MSAMWAGVAQIDITPEGPVMLEAYHRNAPTEEIADRLSATVLVAVGADRVPMVLASIDHVGLLLSETQKVRKRVAGILRTPVERVVCFFTHTHSAPRATPEYVVFLEDRVAKAAMKAYEQLRPCRGAWGVGEVDAAMHRRPRDAQGHAYHGVDATSGVDRRLGVLRIDDEGGDPRLALLWYGAHGNVLKGDSNAISADWPGAARRVVEGELGCPVLVVQGASGNVDPRWRGGPEELRRMGTVVGRVAIDVWRRIEPASIHALGVRSETIPLHLMPLPGEGEVARIADDVLRHWEVHVDDWLAEVCRLRAQGRTRPPSLSLDVTISRIGDGLLGGIPMEPFTEIGKDVASRFETPLFFGGYTNGWIGYLPTAEEHAAGGYEVEWAPAVYGLQSGWMRPVVPSTASRVVEVAAGLASRLLT